ncbi:MAG: Gfo/Idh/MocA family oxidoreductase [Chloroflexales bacterium]|nr:Gfo/Idh/MocA family oxidoreductase [Chloroflexales bacterium]
MPAPRPLRVAVLGCGYWGVNYIRVFNELPEVTITAVCDLHEKRLRAVGQRLPSLGLATDLDDLLRREDVDAVVICTEASAHHAVARRCLAAGKHVLIEKPMTTDVEQARELVGLAEARGLVLMTGHVFLFNPGVRKLKEYIAQGKLGRVYYLYARRTNLGPIRRDVDVLWDLATHDVAIFGYLLDRFPQWVSAVGVRVLGSSHEDIGFISIGYGDGVVGHIHVSWADANKVREVAVVGSDMRIVFDDLNSQEQVRVYEKGVSASAPAMASYGEYHFQMRDGDIISPKVEVSEPLKNQCLHFVGCIAEGCEPLTNGREGLQVVQVMAAIERSIAQSGAPISLAPLKC